jgi:hypothetical protein
MDDESGITYWLIYLIVALCAGIFSLVQKHFGSRLTAVKDDVDKMEEHHTSCQSNLARDRREWDRRFEARRLENKEDFRLLHQKVESGHREILIELKKRNGRT